MSEPKIVLQLPMQDAAQLAAFVDACLAGKASLIAVVGDGCEEVEDEIDQLIIGDGTDQSRFATTTSHPGETLEEVLEFANGWADDSAPTKLVRI